MDISFYSRFHAPLESAYLEEVLASGLETDGLFMKRLLDCADSLYPGCRFLFTPSCTLALETALACLRLHPGDEVLLPSFNFPSAANAVLRHGGRPVLCDITPDTQNISVRDASNRLTSRTRAVIAMHYAGVSAPLGGLKKLADEAGIALIEDAAQCVDAYYEDQPLGTVGDMGCVSFHHTKNAVCGEGGLMITKNHGHWQYARQYRLHGTNRAGYLDGEAARYTWNLPGSCTALSEPQAALLLAQLQCLSLITRSRLHVTEQYWKQLAPLEERGIAMRMRIPAYARPNGHIFYLRFQDPALLNSLIPALAAHGIDCKTHYVPLHASPMGEKLGYHKEDLPESLACYQTLLRLPVHTALTDEDIARTTEAILRFV